MNAIATVFSYPRPDTLGAAIVHAWLPLAARLSHAVQMLALSAPQVSFVLSSIHRETAVQAQWLMPRKMSSTAWGTTAFPRPLSLSTRLGTP